MRSRWRLIGYCVQALTIFFGIDIAYNGYPLIGLLLSAGSISVDVLITNTRKQRLRAIVKFVILTVGIVLWFKCSNTKQLSGRSRSIHVEDSALYARTRRIIPNHMRKPLQYDSTKQSDSLSKSRKYSSSASKDRISTDKNTDLEQNSDIGTNKLIHSKPKKSQKGQEVTHEINNASVSLLSKIFGYLPPSDFTELRYRDSKEIRTHLSQVFDELPSSGFLHGFKNPCWKYSAALNPKLPATLNDLYPDEREEPVSLACLPYAYVLGQPKCGTSDLFERLKRHPDIRYVSRRIISWHAYYYYYYFLT